MKKFLLPLVTLTVPFTTFAQQSITNQQPLPGVVSDATGLLSLVNDVLAWVFTGILILSTFFFLYAAFLYVTARGEEDQVKQAKNVLLYGVIGIVVAVLAQSIQFVVRNVLGAA